jgi:hypothetical protein
MAKIYISYKQTWVSDKELQKNLWFLKKQIESLWNETFIYYFDWDNKLPVWEFVYKFYEEIKKSDIFFCFINHKEKSEWQLLELWMAYTLGKKIILLINEEVKDNYFLSYWTADHIFYFKNLVKDFPKI